MRSILVYIMLVIAVGATAQTSSRIKSLEEQRKKSQAKLEETQQLLTGIDKTMGNALKRLSLLNQTVTERRNTINILNAEINEVDSAIRAIEHNIKLLEKELISKKSTYAESVRKMYLNQNEQNKLLFIFSADNFAQSYRRIQYLKEFSKWERRQAEDVVKKQTQLNEEKGKLLQAKAEKLDMLQSRKDEEDKLVAEENVQKSEVKELQSARKQLNVELEKQKKQALALNRAIEKAIADEIARAEREAKAAADAAKALAERTQREKEQAQAKTKKNKKEKTTVTVQEKPEEVADTRPRGSLEVTKEDRVLTGNFLSNRGKLPYPLKGNYKLVSGFGAHQDPELKRVEVNNSGIDLLTTSGNTACSVFEGEVTSIFVIPGKEGPHGIIIRHGNYLTAYCNVENLLVKKGDKVSLGQALGTVYSDPDEGAVLHFEIREEAKKMNPLNWLR